MTPTERAQIARANQQAALRRLQSRTTEAQTRVPRMSPEAYALRVARLRAGR